MDVAQLLNAFGLAPKIEIVILRLPHMPPSGPRSWCATFCLSICSATESLARSGSVIQQMDVLRHDHVSRDVEAVPVSRALKRLFKDVAGSGRAQKRRSPIAAKS